MVMLTPLMHCWVGIVAARTESKSTFKLETAASTSSWILDETDASGTRVVYKNQWGPPISTVQQPMVNICFHSTLLLHTCPACGTDGGTGLLTQPNYLSSWSYPHSLWIWFYQVNISLSYQRSTGKVLEHLEWWISPWMFSRTAGPGNYMWIGHSSQWQVLSKTIKCGSLVD